MTGRIFNKLISAHLLLVFACLAWGGSYAVGRYGLNSGSAIWLTFWRWSPGAVLFTIYIGMCWGAISQTVITSFAKLTFISCLGVVLYPASLFLAVSETTALNASLYLAVTPVLIVLLSRLVWGEKISSAGWVAIFVGLIGAMVLLFRGDLRSILEFRIAANDFWAVVSAFSWAVYCVSLPMKPKELNEIQFLGVLIVIGSAILGVIGLIVGVDSIPLPDTETMALSMVYFAIFPSILAFLTWNYATSQVGPSVAAPYNNLVPLVGGLFGILFLGETIEFYHMLGGGCIFLSLLINGFRG